VTESQIETGREIQMGPVDLVVIEFAQANFTGAGLPILLDLVAKGVVRVIDAAVVKANEDGSFVSVAVADLGQATEEWKLISGWSSGILSAEDVDAVGAILKPGAAAAVIMYENTWAAPFAASMRAAGGELVAGIAAEQERREMLEHDVEALRGLGALGEEPPRLGVALLPLEIEEARGGALGLELVVA